MVVAGTNPSDSFWFQQGSGNALMVFFNSGWPCWSEGSGDKPRLAGSKARFAGDQAASVDQWELLPGYSPTEMGGLFDRSNPSSPVRDCGELVVLRIPTKNPPPREEGTNTTNAERICGTNAGDQ